MSASGGAQWALVVIGVITFFAVWYQARETRRAAQATELSAKAASDAVEVSKQNVSVARESADAARDSVIVAEKSAAAAKQSADAIINSERAWVMAGVAHTSNLARVLLGGGADGDSTGL